MGIIPSYKLAVLPHSRFGGWQWLSPVGSPKCLADSCRRHEFLPPFQLLARMERRELFFTYPAWNRSLPLIFCIVPQTIWARSCPLWGEACKNLFIVLHMQLVPLCASASLWSYVLSDFPPPLPEDYLLVGHQCCSKGRESGGCQDYFHRPHSCGGRCFLALATRISLWICCGWSETHDVSTWIPLCSNCKLLTLSQFFLKHTRRKDGYYVNSDLCS